MEQITNSKNLQRKFCNVHGNFNPSQHCSLPNNALTIFCSPFKNFRFLKENILFSQNIYETFKTKKKIHRFLYSSAALYFILVF